MFNDNSTAAGQDGAQIAAQMAGVMEQMAALAETPPTPQLNQEAIRRIGATLISKFARYKADRRQLEVKWMQSLYQFKGMYDKEIVDKLDPNRSRAYPRITRVKVVSMVSRLMDMMFPTSERNWSVSPSECPNLPIEVVQEVLNRLAAETGGALDDAMIAKAIKDEATTRARALEREIDDQLQELGGDRATDYVALARAVVYDAVVYGCGVLKGPFVRKQTQTRWEYDRGANRFLVREVQVMRPQFEHVSLWNYYPDLSAKRFGQMEGQFERHVMSRAQVARLAKRPDFFKDAVNRFLTGTANGNYKRETFETEMRMLGDQANVRDTDANKYELIEWTGFVPAKDLIAAGMDVVQLGFTEIDDVEVNVWMAGDIVVKADINPWVELDVSTRVNTYHQFVFEEDESTLTGQGLPSIMRDSQLSAAAATRMLIDNAGVTCGPQLELNVDLLVPDQDTKAIGSYRVWEREGRGAEANVPAIRAINVDGHLEELKGIVAMFREIADMETFVNPATGGDMSNSPSEPFRTAAGASMLHGHAALPFKDIVRNFDAFTVSVISSLVAFNDKFNDKDELRGDYQAVARGVSSLMAKEVRGIALDSMAMSLQPDERRYLKPYQFLRERLISRDVNISDVLVSEDEAKQIDARASEEAARQTDVQNRLIVAEVHSIMAKAIKDLAQGDKNTAGARVQDAKATFEELDNAMRVTGAGGAGEIAGGGEQRQGGVPGAIGTPPAQT